MNLPWLQDFYGHRRDQNGSHCFICRLPAAGGYHLECVVRNAYSVPKPAAICSAVCLHCPFRRDRPNWMDEGRLMLNRLRMENGISQHCHMAANQFHDAICLGAERCLAGGDDLIYSPQELLQLEPCPSDRMLEVYNA